MIPESRAAGTEAKRPGWYLKMAVFEKPDLARSLLQIINTLIPYAGLWLIMILALKEGYPYWVVLVLAVPAGLFMVRLFVLFHDCTHHSLFVSKQGNAVCGTILGILTFTPYDKWGGSHWRHHATVADLDRRGQGDFWTMTKAEYLSAPRWKRRIYRLARNPLIAFGLGPLFTFLIYQRFPLMARSRRERWSVLWTDLGILILVLIAAWTIGLKSYLSIQIPILFVGGLLGFWLFYVQHNFEGVYWSRHEDWDRVKAALQGSSFYKLPAVLRWFTGNIGYHYIHHLRPLIPNYCLVKCCRSVPELQKIRPLNIRRSLRSLVLHLWDEKSSELVPFKTLKRGG